MTSVSADVQAKKNEENRAGRSRIRAWVESRRISRNGGTPGAKESPTRLYSRDGASDGRRGRESLRRGRLRPLRPSHRARWWRPCGGSPCRCRPPRFKRHNVMIVKRRFPNRDECGRHRFRLARRYERGTRRPFALYWGPGGFRHASVYGAEQVEGGAVTPATESMRGIVRFELVTGTLPFVAGHANRKPHQAAQEPHRHGDPRAGLEIEGGQHSRCWRAAGTRFANVATSSPHSTGERGGRRRSANPRSARCWWLIALIVGRVSAAFSTTTASDGKRGGRHHVHRRSTITNPALIGAGLASDGIDESLPNRLSQHARREGRRTRSSAPTRARTQNAAVARALAVRGSSMEGSVSVATLSIASS